MKHFFTLFGETSQPAFKLPTVLSRPKRKVQRFTSRQAEGATKQTPLGPTPCPAVPSGVR
ncbi:hypothetical protein [Spirosoma pomorum]